MITKTFLLLIATFVVTYTYAQESAQGVIYCLTNGEYLTF